MTDYRRLINIAEVVLDTATDGMTAAGYAVPAFQFVSPGIPAFDDEMVAVSVRQVIPVYGDPASQNAYVVRKLHERVAEFIVWLVVPSPMFETSTGEIILPTAGELADASERLYGSQLAIIKGVLDGLRAGRLGTGTVVFDKSEIVGPAGGYVAVVTSFTIDTAATPA